MINKLISIAGCVLLFVGSMAWAEPNKVVRLDVPVAFAFFDFENGLTAIIGDDVPATCANNNIPVNLDIWTLQRILEDPPEIGFLDRLIDRINGKDLQVYVYDVIPDPAIASPVFICGAISGREPFVGTARATGNSNDAARGDWCFLTGGNVDAKNALAASLHVQGRGEGLETSGRFNMFTSVVQKGCDAPINVQGRIRLP